jgi:3-oxoacyl-[acyl-carrier-protein] synthase-3
MLYSNVCLHSFGHELPPKIITSTELEERLAPVYDRLKLPAGRLELMSGIRERRLWEPGTRPSKAAALAGEKALNTTKIPREDIGCMIFTSVSRDMMEPATATFIHNHLKLKPECQIFDLSNACLGFLNGMIMLANMIELGQVKAGLIVAGETAEDLLESTINHLLTDKSLTRKTIKHTFASLTIGSGAVALVMSDKRYSDSGHYLKGGVCRANTSHNNLCQGAMSGTGTIMATDSEELLKRGIETAHHTWNDFTKEVGWDAEIIDHFFCHQVGRAHAAMLFQTLGLEPEKNFETLATLGNVGSVSAPITMALAIKEGIITNNQLAAILGIGSGINSLMLGIDW